MRFGTLLSGLVIAAFAATGAWAADPVKLRIQYAGSVPGQWGPLLLAKTDLYKHYGKSYTIENVSIRGSGPALTAIAAGELEIAALSYESFANGILRAHLPLVVIADVLATGIKGWGDDPFMVRKGSGIKKVEDLRGHAVAVISRGSMPDTALRRMFSKHGLEAGKDYQIVEVGVPAQLPTLASKKVDLAFFTEPFTSIAEKQGKFETLFTVTDAMGPTQSVNWVASKDFIAKHRAAMVDFMEDHIRFRHWIFDPKNRQAALELVAKVTKRPVAAYAGWAFTHREHWRSRNARPNLDLLQENVDDAVKMGLVAKSIDVQEHSDMSLIDDALKRIGDSAERE